MSDHVNPYRPPNCAGDSPRGRRNRRKLDKLAFAYWPVVCAANSMVPLLVALLLTPSAGRYGIAAGIVVLLLAGWTLCFLNGPLAWKFILGSLLLAPTQLLPIIQFTVGNVAFQIAVMLGLAVSGDGEMRAPAISSELGGLLITLVTGAALMAGAGVLGVVAALLLPQRWLNIITGVGEAST